MREQWRAVRGFEEFYEVSDQGRVMSLRMHRPMKPATHKKGGYQKVVLYGVDNKKSAKIHVLVAEAFLGPRPPGLDVCHNNGDGSDNVLTNLRYDTKSSNSHDKDLHGTDHYKNRTHCPRKHELKEPNLRAEKVRLGQRACRACHQARSDVHNHPEFDFIETADHRYALLMAGH